MWSVAASGVPRKALSSPNFVNTLPLSANTTYCFGYSYSSSVCKIYQDNAPASAGTAAADTVCGITKLKTLAAATEYATAYAAVYGAVTDTYAAPGGSSVQAGIDGALTAVTALAKTAALKNDLVRVATEYQGLMGTAKTVHDNATAGLTSTKTTKEGG